MARVQEQQRRVVARMGWLLWEGYYSQEARPCSLEQQAPVRTLQQLVGVLRREVRQGRRWTGWLVV